MSNTKANSGFRGSDLMDTGVALLFSSPPLKDHVDYHVRDGPFVTHCMHSTEEKHLATNESCSCMLLNSLNF